MKEFYERGDMLSCCRFRNRKNIELYSRADMMALMLNGTQNLHGHSDMFKIDSATMSPLQCIYMSKTHENTVCYGNVFIEKQPLIKYHGWGNISNASLIATSASR